MKKPHETFDDFLVRIYPEKHKPDEQNLNKVVGARTVTFQVTEDCNLACTYCYQICKTKKVMKFEDAKKAIDKLLNEDRLNGYVTLRNSPGIILEFIGGEPFLEVELINKICDYFFEQAILLKHPWALHSRISISSNGTLYFKENVQKFINKYQNKLSLGITVDGNKELHDSCRIFPDGSPSYDLAIAAVKDWTARGNHKESKLTISPENLNYLDIAIIDMVKNDYYDINANCVFEDVWKLKDAIRFYDKLKIIADYWIDNDLTETHYLQLFEEYESFTPDLSKNNLNYCGGTGNMLAIDPNGDFFPCLRYMESSVGKDVSPVIIGNVNDGIGQCDEYKKTISCLECVDRRKQSTNECFYCPLAKGCAWCSAYNYQYYHCHNKRTTTLCEMQKAKALANVYFWNKYYKKKNINKVFLMYIPKSWALEIIDENEYNMLISLVKTQLNKI